MDSVYNHYRSGEKTLEITLKYLPKIRELYFPSRYIERVERLEKRKLKQAQEHIIPSE